MPNQTQKADPWQTMSNGEDMVAFTYSGQQGSNMEGVICMIRPSDILYFREFGGSGSFVLTLDRNTGKPQSHKVSEKPAEVLAQLGQQGSPTYEEAQAANALPTTRLPSDHFVCGRTNRHDSIQSGTRVYLRLDRISQMRTGKLSKGKAVVTLNYPSGTSSRTFALEETPNQLLALAGRPAALTYADKKKLEAQAASAARP